MYSKAVLLIALASGALAVPFSSISGIPGGCNPAHPGSCPTTTSAPAYSSITGIPGGCNPAHPGSCPTTTSAVSFSSIYGIPGGCNPAHPGSCPTTASGSTLTTATAPATTSEGTAPTPTSGVSGWTVQNLNRYCSDDNYGCDYNFDFNTNDGSALRHCTIVRVVSNGPTESWYNIPCGSAEDTKNLQVSWGYATNPGPPFAVMTIVDPSVKKLAYFGIANVNEQPVTPSNPFGSGQYGNIGPQPLYAF